MRTSFDAEATVHAVAALAAILSGYAAHALVAPDPVYGFFWAMIWSVIAISLIRPLVRNPVRRAFGLGPDTLPWWFKLRFVRATPDLVRETAPDWHVYKDRVYLPGVGHAIGALVSYNLATLGLILILPDVHRSFVIVPAAGLAGLAIPWFRAVIIRDYTLPEPGQSDRFFFFPPR